MSVMLLTEQHLEFLSLKGGCTGSSESTLVRMPHCWKSHRTAQLRKITYNLDTSVCLFPVEVYGIGYEGWSPPINKFN